MTSKRLLDPVTKALLDAADVMDARGFCQHQQEDGQGRVCVQGAISIALSGRSYAMFSREYMDATQRLTHYLAENGSPYMRGRYGGAEWNNRPGRTKEEAVAAMRAAALYTPVSA